MSSKTEGFYPSSRKVHVSGNSHPDIRVPFREITLTPTHVADGTVEENEPLARLRYKRCVGRRFTIL